MLNDRIESRDSDVSCVILQWKQATHMNMFRDKLNFNRHPPLYL